MQIFKEKQRRVIRKDLQEESRGKDVLKLKGKKRIRDMNGFKGNERE